MRSYDEQSVRFEGFNVYRYESSSFSDPQLIKTYDKVNGITLEVDFEFNPALVGLAGVDPLVPIVRAFGTDSGLQYYHEIEGSLVNNRDYYYGVTAYGVDPDAELRRVFESLPSLLTVRPTRQTGITDGGSQSPSAVNDMTLFERRGDSFRTLSARVVNPRAIQDAVYRVDIVPVVTGVDTTETYTVTRTLANGVSSVLFDGASVASSTGRIPRFDESQIIDGLAFFDVSASIPSTDFQDIEGDNEDFDVAGTGLLNGEAVAGIGIVETESSRGPSCSVIDLGCDFYDGNTVFGSPDAFNTYFIATRDGATAQVDDAREVTSNVNVSGADDYEIRFTERCVNDATPCYAVYSASLIPGDDSFVTRVPFEAYQVGLTENDDRDDVASDDIRLIPLIRPVSEDDKGESIIFDSWSNSFVTEFAVPAGVAVPTGTPDSLAYSDEVYLFYPTQPDGYELFAAAATASGGAGTVYQDTFVGDPDCSRSSAYADFCYRSDVAGGNRNYVVGRILFADLDGDGNPPSAGTTVQFGFVGKRNSFSIGDVYTLNTADIAFITGQTNVAEDALDGIGVTPNPYRGRSEYERSSNDRRVRFVGLPEQARIQIFTVAGSLIRTINKSGPGTTVDWNLETENNLPVASGMYLVHIEARDGNGVRIGERVLKLGVIQRKTRISVF